MAKNRFGKAFPDQVKKSSTKFNHKDGGTYWQDALISPEIYENPPTSDWRKVTLVITLFLALVILFGRLFHLQVIEGKSSRELADSNRIQVKVIHAPRGVIYDRNGKILANNEPGFRLVEGTGSSKVRNINRDDYLKMQAAQDPRVKLLEVDNYRSYPFGEKSSHILGYVSEITEDELKDPNLKGYKLGDKVGRGGVEEAYEKVLKGVDGGEVIEIDAAGNKIRTLRKVDAIPGQNLYLTIDAELQSYAFDKLKEGVSKANSCCGAVIAQDPNSGQILVMASYPSFNLPEITSALTNTNSPILNRTIGGTYPPGSTFKIASTLAGLKSGKITQATQFEDTGEIFLGPFKFSNWYFTQYGRKDEGGVDLVKALKRSNDIFFYRLGQLTGEKVLGEIAKELGMGKKMGIDIPGEASGLIPDNDWKVKNIGEVWYPGDTLHMAIGQGFVLATPLQINSLSAVVAASGKQFPPHLALKITQPNGKTVKEFRYDGKQGQFKDTDIELIKKGLAEVTVDGGTAWPFFSFPVKTAGKTGTAEFGDAKKTHAWYTSYAPFDYPIIAMTVLIEGGGEGSSVAAPIIKEVYRWYFSQDKKNLIKDTIPVSSTSAILKE